MTDAELNAAIVNKLEQHEPHWFCPACMREVSPQMVRYNETHYGCGATCKFVDTKDYCNDLNAMQQARLSLNTLQRNQFVYELLRVLSIDADEPTDPDDMFRFANAEPRERAEAFARAVGIWKEGAK